MSSRTKCSVDGCGRRVFTWDYCRGHYSRWKQHGDPNAGRNLNGVRKKNSAGYNMKYVTGRGWMPVHRAAMEEHLGRPLVKGETVHHKDGIKTNNNLANLELMVSYHPPGQRPQDLVPWACEVLQRYAPEKLR